MQLGLGMPLGCFMGFHSKWLCPPTLPFPPGDFTAATLVGSHRFGPSGANVFFPWYNRPWRCPLFLWTIVCDKPIMIKMRSQSFLGERRMLPGLGLGSSSFSIPPCPRSWGRVRFCFRLFSFLAPMLCQRFPWPFFFLSPPFFSCHSPLRFWTRLTPILGGKNCFFFFFFSQRGSICGAFCAWDQIEKPPSPKNTNFHPCPTPSPGYQRFCALFAFFFGSPPPRGVESDTLLSFRPCPALGARNSGPSSLSLWCARRLLEIRVLSSRFFPSTGRGIVAPPLMESSTLLVTHLRFLTCLPLFPGSIELFFLSCGWS